MKSNFHETLSNQRNVKWYFHDVDNWKSITIYDVDLQLYNILSKKK